jgi:hypothetical protein
MFCTDLSSLCFAAFLQCMGRTMCVSRQGNAGHQHHEKTDEQVEAEGDETILRFVYCISIVSVFHRF